MRSTNHHEVFVLVKYMDTSMHERGMKAAVFVSNTEEDEQRKTSDIATGVVIVHFVTLSLFTCF